MVNAFSTDFVDNAVSKIWIRPLTSNNISYVVKLLHFYTVFIFYYQIISVSLNNDKSYCDYSDNENHSYVAWSRLYLTRSGLRILEIAYLLILLGLADFIFRKRDRVKYS